MVRLSGDFGMTPATRARIAARVWPEPSSKFGDLLGDEPRAEFCARLTRMTKLAISWPVARMRSRRSPCLRAPSIEWFRAGGERPARSDVTMDRRRRGELVVLVFARPLRILSDRRLDRQRAAPRSSIQFDRSCRFRWQASPWVWAVSGWSCPRPRQCQGWLRPSPPQDSFSPVEER